MTLLDHNGDVKAVELLTATINLSEKRNIYAIEWKLLSGNWVRRIIIKETNETS